VFVRNRAGLQKIKVRVPHLGGARWGDHYI